MTSNKPYLVSAIFDWIIDNEATPYLLVDAHVMDVEVPTQFVKDGQIVLNIAPEAVRDFYKDQSCVSFSARFGGIPSNVFVPMRAVLGIYAKENGQGMMFDQEEQAEESTASTLSMIHTLVSSKTSVKSTAGEERVKPSLRVVK